MTDGVPDTKLIKQAMVFRAKYKTKNQAEQQFLKCFRVVPHNDNRGGEPVRCTRTKSLAADICQIGFSREEAEASSVCVEVGKDNASKYQDHFKANTGKDPDHYVGEIAAEYGALSHNTLNVACRNILFGMPGCACAETSAVAEKCSCTANGILEADEKGVLRYSMEKLRKADYEWFMFIEGGVEWEILSSDMDIEAPEAAHIIAVALNDRNIKAMVTGHLELMRYLQSLCKPGPHGELVWHDVKASMCKTFGKQSMVDDENYHHAFKLITVSGGHQSHTWADVFR